MVDPWDAFGGDDDDDGSNDNDADASMPTIEKNHHDSAVAVTTALTKIWLNEANVAMLQHRRVLLIVLVHVPPSRDTAVDATTDTAHNSNTSVSESEKLVVCWKNVLASKRIHDVTVAILSDLMKHQNDDIRSYDAIIMLSQLESHITEHFPSLLNVTDSILVNGGYFVFHQAGNRYDNNTSSKIDWMKTFSDSVWDVESAINIRANPNSSICWTIIPKWSCKIATEACTWLSKKHSISNERRLMSSATISLSVYERENGYVNPTSLKKAVQALQQYGYSIVTGLLHNVRKTCLEYGSAAMSDLHLASTILKEQHGVDILEPSLSVQGPGTYRELSMREDYRMDLRRGPSLQGLRGADGNQPITYKASDQGNSNDFLRGNRNILAIVRRAMNPPSSKDRYIGNYGRYNFEGSGPDGSDRDLVAGPVGAIINLPGSADQAIHADTPHLFEHNISPSPLPPHYVNIFTLGCYSEKFVGQTAFIHGSHCMDYVANHIRKDSTIGDFSSPFLPSLWKNLVRPQMELGDIIIFDCRILHFGLANQHKVVPRPMLYTNMTLHWFHDPKNWDNHTCIFKENEKK